MIKAWKHFRRTLAVLTMLPALAAVDAAAADTESGAPILATFIWTEGKDCAWALLEPVSGARRVYHHSPECPSELVWDATGLRTVYLDQDQIRQLDWRPGAKPTALARLPKMATAPTGEGDTPHWHLWVDGRSGAIRIGRPVSADGPVRWLTPGKVLGVPHGGRLHPFPITGGGGGGGDGGATDAAAAAQDVAGPGDLGVLLIDEWQDGRWVRIDEPGYVRDGAGFNPPALSTVSGRGLSLASLEWDMATGDNTLGHMTLPPATATALRRAFVERARGRRSKKAEDTAEIEDSVLIFALGDGGVLTGSEFGDVLHVKGPATYCQPGCTALGKTLALGAVAADGITGLAGIGPLLLVTGDGAALFRYPDSQPIATVPVGSGGATVRAFLLPLPQLWHRTGPASP